MMIFLKTYKTCGKVHNSTIPEDIGNNFLNEYRTALLRHARGYP